MAGPQYSVSIDSALIPMLVIRHQFTSSGHFPAQALLLRSSLAAMQNH